MGKKRLPATPVIQRVVRATFILCLSGCMATALGESCGRTFDLQTSGTPNPSVRVAKPPIVERSKWGGTPPLPGMKSHFPSKITIHHEGSPKPLTPDKDPKQLLRNLQKWGASEKKWADLPYHFLIDIRGTIYAGRDPLAVGDTSTSYDPAGHLLVTFMGNYELQNPTDAQLKAACDLIAWACDYYNVDPATVRGHEDYVPTTQCPGKTLYPRVESGWFREEVCRRLDRAYAGKSDTPGTATVSRAKTP